MVSRLLILFLCAVATPALAQQAAEPVALGNNGAWTAYRIGDGAERVCFIASQPTRDEGDYTRRGDIFTVVSHLPAQSRFDEVSVVAGYTYREGADVTIQVDGGNRFTLFTQGDRAWTPDDETDARLVQAMVRGNQMVVRGTSSRGTLTTDTYSLVGFTASRNLIEAECRG